MHNDSPHIPDDEWHYRPTRPAASAMVAAVSVSVAIFVLGGYLRTYLQLKELRVEYKRKLDELENFKRQDSRSRSAVAKRRPEFSLPDLPPARGGTGIPRPSGRMEIADIPRRSASVTSRASEDGLDEMTVPAPRPRQRPAATVLAGIPPSLPPAAGVPPLEERAERVVSVSRETGTVVVEGGRDRHRAVGQILALRRGGSGVGKIRVKEVFAGQSIGEIVNEQMPLLPGDIVAGRAESQSAWHGD